MLSPSAANLQPWEFLVIESEPLLSRVKEAYSRDWLQDAPQILVVSGFENQAWQRRFDGYRSIETDLAIAMTHLLLAATDEGVATCWISAFDPQTLAHALELKEDQRVYGITPLGYAAASVGRSPKTRKQLEQVVRFL